MPKTLLVIRFSAIGDLLLTAPVLQSLTQEGVKMDLLVKERNAKLAEVFPNLRSIILWESQAESLLSEARSTYDAVLDLQGTRQSKRYTKKLGLPVATFNKPYLKRALLLLTKHTRFTLSPVVLRYADAATSLFEDLRITPVSDPNFDLPSCRIQPNKNYVVAVIGGSREGKRLTSKVWEEILSALMSNGQPVVLLGGPSDSEQATTLQNLYPEVIDATGTSVEQGLTLISNAALTISGDTGFMHAAALMNIPLVSFWGATHPNLGFAPWPKRSNQREVITRSKLSPLHKHGKVPFWSKNPVNQISTPELIDAIEQMLPGRTMP